MMPWLTDNALTTDCLDVTALYVADFGIDRFPAVASSFATVGGL